MDESESEIVIPAEPDVVEIEVPEPEIIETVTEDEEAWQQPEPLIDPELVAPVMEEVLTALLTQNYEAIQGLMGQQTILSNQIGAMTNLLQSALPGLQVLATLADETTDRKMRQQINKTMRGRR